MKFISNKGAPDIPIELIEAQESKDLVFFCGAGVSYKAGLPGFSGLVEKIYENLHLKKSKLELEAIKAELFDRALGLLEARIVSAQDTGVNLMRREIIEILTISSDVDLSTHKAILQLSKTGEGKYRVVTTNVDHGFLYADPEIIQIVDAAPKLPVPKPHKWETVVHLHGIIKDRDSNGSNLIFTSGDFGMAYLTERWASKFVTELFNHFTVLFVGYSVNDPVIRYMTDAIAAERLRGYGGFKQPYAIVNTKPSQKLSTEDSWRAKGIEPILYEYTHENLHRTIRAWAEHVRDGLNAKARIIAKEGLIAPLAPYNEDASVIRVLDVLREKSKPNHQSITGYPAKKFSELANPPAPIEWLKVLHENNLLSIAQPSEKSFPINRLSCQANLIMPNKISLALWYWMLNHLENDILINYVIDQGVCLHPVLKDMICHAIERKPPADPYLQFWRVVVSEFVHCDKRFLSDGFEYVKELRSKVDELNIAQFSKLLEPTIKLTKAFDWSRFVDDSRQKFRRSPFDIEVVIGLSDWLFKELQESKFYPEKIAGMLLTVTNSLKRALDLWSFAGVATRWHDRSYYDLKSIMPHPQNTHYRNWVILIEICRDLWISTWDMDRDAAYSVLGVWRTIDYPVFRRLILHVLTMRSIYPEEEALEYLLEDNHWWLWSNECRREVFRFLDVFWPKLSDHTSDKLINAILQGPPRKMYREDLKTEEWNYRFEREVWLKLAKLQSFGRCLPESANHVRKKLESIHLNWSLQEKDKDEFTSWIETRTGHDVDITIEELFAKEIKDIVELLTEKNTRYREGRVSLFRFGCKTNIEKTIEVVRFCAENKIAADDIWHAALVGLAECEANTWNKISSLLLIVDDQLFNREGWSIAWYLKKSSNNFECGSKEEDTFFSICDRILHNAPDENGPSEDRDSLNYAINQPVGIISEALMERFAARKYSSGQGLAPGPLKDIVNQIVASDKIPAIAGKIIFSSRLNYFFAVDPLWTKSNLIPLFDCKKADALLMWQGYLWNARISIDLAIALKDYMLEAINKVKDRDAESLFQLFTAVCLEFQDVFKVSEMQDALFSMGNDGLAHVADYLWKSVSADPKSSDSYWNYRIQPFMKKAWPRSSDFLNEKISEKLALMAIELDESFCDSVAFLQSMLKRFDDLSFFINNLERKELAEKFPLCVLNLLAFIFTDEYLWPRNDFRKILNRLIQANPQLREDVRYKAIDEFLLQHGL
jgi:hypothetical protein